MSLFGQPDTPEGTKVDPSARRLAELSLKLHRAVLDPLAKATLIHAEAKTGFSDGTVEPGLTVSYFLNGIRIQDVQTDDFGLAVLHQKFPPDRFLPDENELAVRVRGAARDAKAQFRLLPSFTLKSIETQGGRFNSGPPEDKWTFTVTIRAEARIHRSDVTDPAGVSVVFFLNGKRICETKTDELGCASLAHQLTFSDQRELRKNVVISAMEEWKTDCVRFVKNAAHNVLAARIAGFSNEVQSCFYWDGSSRFEAKE